VSAIAANDNGVVASGVNNVKQIAAAAAYGGDGVTLRKIYRMTAAWRRREHAEISGKMISVAVEDDQWLVNGGVSEWNKARGAA